MPSLARNPGRYLVLLALAAPALLVGLLTTVGPLRTDPVAAWAGVGVGHRPGWLGGYISIDPNVGVTSFALGFRAARELLSGTLPLWNHYEGLGAPLLGEMQSAALFPPTWLLLLPYGQAIEQALLQAVAGVGTFLFLRRFGLGTAAALTGGLLFEFNGVFAWLRNAVYNPVAFLPWLFYAVESLFRIERAGGGAERWRAIGGGAVAAALAVYAGFPEVVYLYSVLLAGWVGLRGLSLPLGRAVVFGADLLAMAGLAVLVSAPVLIAFGHFLPEAAVGGHHGMEFLRHYLPPQAFLVALLPYVFGPISAVPQMNDVWGNIGGYVGVAPLVLAVAGLVCSWRCAASWLLALWVVLAVGASHGVPVLHGMVTALPLAALAAYCRYLDAGWIFACVVLAATFIDRVGAMGAAERRRVVVAAGLVLVALVGVGVGFAWDVLGDAWQAGAGRRWFVVVSVGTGAGLLGLLVLATRLRRPAAVLAGLAVLEAIAWFMLPFASRPHFAGVDRALIGFLREHAGLQRFAIASGSGLGPNFGSVFGIPSMNYDDLPVPARTARFVATRLDATNDGVIFSHTAPPANEAERAAGRSRFSAALGGYAQAGVRYVLSSDDLGAEPAYPLAPDRAVAVALRAGQEAVLDMAVTRAVDRDGAAPAYPIGAVSLLIGTYGGAADGAVRVALCQGSRCVSGAVPLAGVPDNRGLLVAFDAPMTVSPGVPLRLSVAKEGGRHDVALWMRPGLEAGARLGGVPVPAGYLPVVEWLEAADPRPVLRTPTTTVFEVMHPRPYASAPGCRLDVVSHDRMGAQCDAPSRLLRLEVLLDGWAARVNGAAVPIVAVEDTFQGVALPAGDSVVEFTYAPAGLRPSVPVAVAALALCLALCLAGVGYGGGGWRGRRAGRGG